MREAVIVFFCAWKIVFISLFIERFKIVGVFQIEVNRFSFSVFPLRYKYNHSRFVGNDWMRELSRLPKQIISIKSHQKSARERVCQSYRRSHFISPRDSTCIHLRNRKWESDKQMVTKPSKLNENSSPRLIIDSLKIIESRPPLAAQIIASLFSHFPRNRSNCQRQLLLES